MEASRIAIIVDSVSFAINNPLISNLQPTDIQQQTLQRLAETYDADGQARLIAATCYLTRCAEGVPSADPLHADLIQLQNNGAAFATEIALLQATGDFSAGPSLLSSASDFALRTNGL